MAAFRFKSDGLKAGFQTYMDKWQEAFKATADEDNLYELLDEMKKTAVNAFNANNIEALRLIFKIDSLDFTADDLMVKQAGFSMIPVLTAAIHNGNLKMVEYLLEEQKALVVVISIFLKCTL